MKLTVKVESDNAALTDGTGYELARVLRELANLIEGADDSEALWANLRDVNGNTVGKWRYDPHA